MCYSKEVGESDARDTKEWAVGVYVGVGGGIGPFHAGVGTRLGGRGGRSGSSGGLDGLGMALVLIAVFLAAWLAVAGLWLVVLAALAVSDFAFAAGRGVGWALGSRNRGESIQAGGILRWSAVRWWCRTGVTRMIWGWAFVPARTVWYFLTYRRGPREWLVDGMWVSGVVALLAGITGAIMDPYKSIRSCSSSVQALYLISAINVDCSQTSFC